MDAIFIGITRPEGMTDEEAIARAKELVPVEVGDFEVIDESASQLCGNLYCEDGYYDSCRKRTFYGPDNAGVKVEWEKP